MGSIIVTTSTKKDIITGDIIDSEHSRCHIEIENNVEQVSFHTFIYCASAMRTYPFTVPGDAEDLSEYQLDDKPDCHTCDFKKTYLWDHNTSAEFISIDESAYQHTTHLYKELMADGSLRNNTTYIEIIEAYINECAEDIHGPFEAGESAKCPSCGEMHSALVLSPSRDELLEEEKIDEKNERLYYARDEPKVYSIFITKKLKTQYENTLNKCLLMKAFFDVYRHIFHDDSGEVVEAYKRLMKPKHIKHFLGLKVPLKYKHKLTEWREFLGES